jgi:hypothetical protein
MIELRLIMQLVTILGPLKSLVELLKYSRKRICMDYLPMDLVFLLFFGKDGMFN